MTYGEALKRVFEAFYKDMSDVTTSYTMPSLDTAIASIPAKWRPEIMRDFGMVRHRIQETILLCPHYKESVKTPYHGKEECQLCNSYRMLEREDQDPNSYNERMIWSEWKV